MRGGASAILAQRDALERQLSEQENSKEELEALLAWVSRADQWGELSRETQKELLGRLLAYLEVYKPKRKRRGFRDVDIDPID